MTTPAEPIIPNDPPTPEEVPPTARARRRRAARAAMFPAGVEGQAALIASLSRRAYPSLELFVFSLVCGLIVSLGFLLNSQGVIVLGVLVAPLMIPWVGFLLALYVGSPRFLFETVTALLISGGIAFIAGLLTGFAARVLPHIAQDNVYVHSRLWTPELFVLALGAVTLVASFARSEDKPFLPSILVAYAFYLPIIASGFGLGAGLPGVWLEGLLVFVVHFALASLLGMITLFVLKLQPTKAGGVASGIIVVALLTVFAYLTYPQIIFRNAVNATPTPTVINSTATLPATATQPPTPTFSPTVTPRPVNTATRTAAPVTESVVTSPASPTVKADSVTPTALVTATATHTSLPSATATVVASQTSSAPQITLGIISAGESGGANLRQTPNGKYILTLLNGTTVEVSPEKRNVNGVEWARVFATVREQRVEGWLLAAVIEYNGVTPSP